MPKRYSKNRRLRLKVLSEYMSLDHGHFQGLPLIYPISTSDTAPEAGGVTILEGGVIQMEVSFDYEAYAQHQANQKQEAPDAQTDQQNSASQD